MTDQLAHPARVPVQVSLTSPILNLLLRFGVPLGFNRLVTIRGRTTGLPRTTGLAVIETDGRRWVWAPWGEVNWVRNLRAAGRATITVRNTDEHVRADELDSDQRIGFFRDIFGPYVRSIRGGVTFVRVIDQVDLHHPIEAAEGRRVFELHAVAEGTR